MNDMDCKGVAPIANDSGFSRPPAEQYRTAAMVRKGFMMYVHAGSETEYERRHRPIWDELAATLHAHGVRNYSIFLDPQTHCLFGYAEIESEERWQEIAATDVCRRWWRHMADVMPTNPDSSPVARDVREVFHLD